MIVVELTRQNLINCFEAAAEKGAKFVGLKINVLNCEGPEIIINPRENFEPKLSYYTSAYDENLKLHTVPKIQITGFTYGDDFASIEQDLLH